MFFITPDTPKPVEVFAAPISTIASSPREKRKYDEAFNIAQNVDSYYPKRNQRACDRCRLRKAKCSGGKSCEKCKKDGVICTTNRSAKMDQKPPSVAYVQMVESQRDFLLRALGKLSKIQKPSRADVEKIILELHAPMRTDEENAADANKEKLMAANDITEMLRQQSTSSLDCENRPEEQPPAFEELYNGLTDMENWSTLLSDPWDSLTNMLELDATHAT